MGRFGYEDRRAFFAAGIAAPPALALAAASEATAAEAEEGTSRLWLREAKKSEADDAVVAAEDVDVAIVHVCVS